MIIAPAGYATAPGVQIVSSSGGSAFAAGGTDPVTILRGTVSFGTADLTASATLPVAPDWTKTIVWKLETIDGTEPRNSFCVYSFSGSTFTLTRAQTSTLAITVRYTIAIYASGVSVQHLSGSGVGTTNFTAVASASSFILSFNVSGRGTITEFRNFSRQRFGTPSSGMVSSVVTSGTSQAWNSQVITWAGATVINGDLTVSGGTLSNSASISIDLTRTFLVFSMEASADSVESMVSADLTATTLTLTKSATSATTSNITATYFLVSSTDFLVQHRNVVFGTSDLTATTAINAVNTDRAIVTTATDNGNIAYPTATTSVISSRAMSTRSSFPSATSLQLERGITSTLGITARTQTIEFYATTALESETLVWIGNATNQASGVAPDAVSIAAVDTLVKGLKTDGLWNSIDYLLVAAGSQLAHSRCALRDVSGSIPVATLYGTWVEGNYSRQKGWHCASNRAIDTLWTQSRLGGNLNSFSYGVVISDLLSSTITSTIVDMGARNGTSSGDFYQLAYGFSTNLVNIYAENASPANPSPLAVPIQMCAARSSSTSLLGYCKANGVITTANNTNTRTSSPSINSLFIGGRNAGGGSISFPSARWYRAGWTSLVGLTQTQLDNLTARLETFESTLKAS